MNCIANNLIHYKVILMKIVDLSSRKATRATPARQLRQLPTCGCATWLACWPTYVPARSLPPNSVESLILVPLHSWVILFARCQSLLCRPGRFPAFDCAGPVLLRFNPDYLEHLVAGDLLVLQQSFGQAVQCVTVLLQDIYRLSKDSAASSLASCNRGKGDLGLKLFSFV
jgi:hypothetical protein